jgi:hypothetical protein
MPETVLEATVTPRVITLRPRPRRVPTRPVPSSAVRALDGPVSVEWDEARELYVLSCHRCTDTLTLLRLDEAYESAETHRCDPELAALLDHITRGAV